MPYGVEWMGAEMGREVRRILGPHGSCPPMDRLGAPAVRLGRLTVVCPCAYQQRDVASMYKAWVERIEVEDCVWVHKMRVFADAGLL